ncbi:Lipase, GDSL, partial [Cynara cardunculus var. scolymus]
MMERSSQRTLFLSVFLLISASADAYVKSVFVFGDSLFDPANGNLKRFPANGINFASAGSGVLPDTSKDSRATPIQVQLQQFQALIRQKHLRRKQIKKSLIFLESGSNDIFTYLSYPDTPPLTPTAYVHAMLKEVVCFLDQIYKLGSRRIALFSVGPIGCIPARVLLPGASPEKCFSRLNKMVRYYNVGLEHLAYTIPIRYPGAVGVYGAVYNTIEDFRANGNLYGFANVNEACCGNGPLNGMLQCGLEGYKICSNPNEFLFWDYFHPSERTYGLVSNAMWAGNQNQIRPINLKTLAQNRIRPIDLKTWAS